MSVPVIEARGIGRTYPTDPPTHALREVDVTIVAGEAVAVVGPSGSGKSTLLSLLGSLERPTNGTVRVRGHEVAGLDEARRAALRARHVGFVFQQFHLVATMTAEQNVATGLLYAGVRRRERLDRAREALDAVGLDHRGTHRPGQLSGGEQQRVAIARALVKRPTVVFADEPTGALDTATGAAVVDLLRGVTDRGTALVVITHDLAVAAAMDRRLHLRDGRVATPAGFVPAAGSEAG